MAEQIPCDPSKSGPDRPSRAATAGLTLRSGKRARGHAASVDAFVDRLEGQGVRLVAVVPAYNEDRFIGSVVLKALPFVDRVIVVDDGSLDRTAAVAREAGAEVIVHPENRGKAIALKTGFSRARELGADVVVTLDGDGQHNPLEIPRVVSPILRGQADMVIGSRFLDIHVRIPIWRRLGQHLLNLLTTVGSGVPCTDSQSGFRAFGPRALAALSFRSQGFAIESEMQFWAREHHLRLVEVPIGCDYTEKPKRNPVRQGLQVLNGILELASQSRPLLVFGVSGLLLALLGTGWWCWIVRTHSRTGELALGCALLATLSLIIGVLCAFEGVTLHTLRRLTHRLPQPAPQGSAFQPLTSGEDEQEKKGLVRA